MRRPFTLFGLLLALLIVTVGPGAARAVPAGSTNLAFNLSGGTGDGDMYVKFGSEPTSSSYDCRPYLGGNAETCTFAAPQTGTYYVQVKLSTPIAGAYSLRLLKTVRPRATRPRAPRGSS